MTADRRVLCIGLTPALQRILHFHQLTIGQVNRATRQLFSPAGKACNAARTLACLGREPLLLGFNGGSSGQALAAQLDAIGVPHDFIRIAEDTRTCTTVIDQRTGEITELVEEAPWPGPDAVDALVASIRRHAHTAAAALICGALPPNADPMTYAQLVRHLHGAGLPVFIDTCGAPFRHVRAEQPLFLKLNHDEQLKTEACAEQEFARHTLEAGASWLLVTNGKHAATVYGADGATRFQPPVIVEKNSVGSGDATLAGTVHAWLDGAPMPAAVRFGLACGTANALTDLPGQLEPAVAAQLLEQVKEERA